jgi:hypothetical protein
MTIVICLACSFARPSPSNKL